MSKILNTYFETALRIILILGSSKTSLTENRISLIDFISLYEKDFGISLININGDSEFNLSEYANKKQLIKEAIIFLANSNLIAINDSTEGFIYSLNKRGQKILNELIRNDSFSQIYLSSVENIIEQFSSSNDDTIFSFMNSRLNQEGL